MHFGLGEPDVEMLDCDSSRDTQQRKSVEDAFSRHFVAWVRSPCPARRRTAFPKMMAVKRRS